MLRHLTSRFPHLLRAGARRVDGPGNYRAGWPIRQRICRRPRCAGKTPDSAPGHRLVATLGLNPDQQRGHGRVGAVEDRAARRWVDRGEGAGRGRVVLAVEPQHRLSLEDRVELDLAALRSRRARASAPPGRDLDQVEAEGRGAERLAGELPGAVAGALHRLELVAMLDRVVICH